MRPLVRSGSGIGKRTKERTPGSADHVEVNALDVAAVDRARFDRRPFHAGETNVDAVDHLAGHLLRHVEVLLLRAHQRPLIRRFDRDLLGMRMRDLRRVLGDLSVRRRATAPRMRDDAVFGGQLRDRHTPPLCRGKEKPFARFGPGQLQVVASVLHGRRGVGPHSSIQTVRNSGNASRVASAECRFAAALRIGCAAARNVERPLRRPFTCIAIGGRVLWPDFLPVALQLFAHHHGVRGPDALTELCLGDPDGHRIVRRDDDPRIDLRC